MPPPIIAMVAMFTRYFNFYAIFSVWHKLNTKQVGNSAVIFWQEKYWSASIGKMIISLLMNITMNQLGGASVIAIFHS